MSAIARLRLHAQLVPLPVASTPAEVVSHLGAVQAQDYQGALWSIALRTNGATRVDVERAIAEGAIVRTWPMRGTLHFVPAVDARWMLELMTPRVMKSAEGRHKQLELDDTTFKHSRSLIEKALTREKTLTRTALFALLEAGKIPTTGQRGIHILQRLCMERMLCYGPYSEKQPTFALFDAWIPASRTLERDDALRTIAERFFVSHGPATTRDFVWWTGLTVAEAKLGLHLAQPSLERLVVDGTDMWMSNALAIAGDDEPRAHLLPGFDEFLLGYKDRSASLTPRYAARVVPGGNGVFLSTLVLDGQVRGTWRRTTRPKLVELEASSFGRLKAQEKKEFARPAERYASFVGTPVRLTWGG